MFEEWFYLSFLVLFGLFLITIIIIGFFFIYKGIHNRLLNVFLAGLGFLSLSLGFIGRFLLNFSSFFLEVFVFISFILTVLFTNLTFHKKRGYRSKLVLLVVIILGLFQLIVHFIDMIQRISTILYYIRVGLDLPYNLLTFGWLGYSSYSDYRLLKERDIEPWIKVRYKLVAFFSFLISINNIPEFFQPKGIFWGDPSNLISLIIFGSTAILCVIFSFGFALAWLMPKPLKKFFNHDYTPIEDKELSEKELIIKIRRELSEKE